MAFDDAAVDALFDKLLSHAAASGYFARVNQHEPKNAPGSGLTAALWVQDISPARSSGLSSTSGLVTLSLRVYQNFASEPFDAIDPTVVKAVNGMLSAYTGDLDLGQTVRCIDLLGMSGTAMRAQAGYVEINKTVYRVMTITIPVIVNDMWAQGG